MSSYDTTLLKKMMPPTLLCQDPTLLCLAGISGGGWRHLTRLILDIFIGGAWAIHNTAHNLKITPQQCHTDTF